MSLSPKEEAELLQLLEWESWSKDPSPFMDDCIITRDEADDGEVSEKRMPKKEYLYHVDKCFVQYPILAIPKSRRMLMTWRLLALHLWYGLFNANREIFIQSKKAEDSAYLLGDKRLMFMYNRLPTRHNWPKVMRTIKGQGGVGFDLIELSNGSSYKAIAEGADQLRQYTASRIYCTEMAFWDRAEATWTSLKPTIQGGGKIVIDSSANPGFFEKLVTGDLNKK
jgi:hypothetical protein